MTFADAQSLIYTTALQDSMPDPLALLITAQAAHETGGFTSNFFVNGNNAFGYSCVNGAKWQSGCGTNADNGVPIALYASVQDSVHEMTDWIKRRQIEGSFPADLSTITDPTQYATLLKTAGYYGDTVANYAAGIASWFSDNIATVAIGGAGLLVIAVLILLAMGKF